MKRKMLLLSLAIPVILCQNAQAQTSSRLTAQSHWSSNGATYVANDSTAYAYSSGRGGDLNHTLKYDYAENWLYVGDTAYANNYYYIQTFDANNNLLSTIARYWNGTAWVNWTNVLYTYNANNSVATMTNQSWGGAAWSNVSQDVYSYNTAGQLYSDQNNAWNGLTSTFTPNTQSIYTYDISGNLLSEVDQTYNAGSGLYNYTDEYLYTYSHSSLLSTTYKTWSGSSWVSNYMYTNAYDTTTGALLTNLYQTYNGTAWVNQSLKSYSNFTPSVLAQTEIDQTWDTTGSGSWSNVTEYMYSYNSYGQLTKTIGESWNVGVGWEFALGDPAAYYYYDTYSTSLVKNVVNGGTVNVFPVPAQNMLHIDLNWNEAQSATISIYDMNGREVSSTYAPFGAQYHGSVSVSNLANGMYTVTINGTQSQIVKQIVVAH